MFPIPSASSAELCLLNPIKPDRKTYPNSSPYRVQMAVMAKAQNPNPNPNSLSHKQKQTSLEDNLLQWWKSGTDNDRDDGNHDEDDNGGHDDNDDDDAKTPNLKQQRSKDSPTRIRILGQEYSQRSMGIPCDPIRSDRTGMSDYSRHSRRRIGISDDPEDPPRMRIGDGLSSDTSPSGHHRLHEGLRLSHEIQRLCKTRQPQKALKLLLEMEEKGVFPSESTYRTFLENCSNLSLVKCIQAHLSRRSLDLAYPLGEVLFVSLLKCGQSALPDALQLFNSLPYRTVFSWSALICNCVECNNANEALKLYSRMKDEGIEPNEYTFVSLFKACGSLSNLEMGVALHRDAREKRLDSNAFVANTLISMYGKCGRIVDAEDVFYGMKKRNLVSWNAMMSAYVDKNEGNNALELYEKMLEEGVNPNNRTFVLMIQACCLLAEQEKSILVNGKHVKVLALEAAYCMHTKIEMKGIVKDKFLSNSLMKLYSKCGSVGEVQRVFNQYEYRDVVSWNTLLSTFVEHGRGEKALRLFRQMREEGVKPDERTFVNVIQSCCMYSEKEEAVVDEGKPMKMISLEIGRAIHADAKKMGFASNIFIVNTLITLYGKCGSLLEAENVFIGCIQPDIVSWTALLSAYLEQDEAGKALLLYREMLQNGIIPDDRTSVIAVQACSRLSEKEEVLLEEGELSKMMCFEIGRALHYDAKKTSFISDVFLKCALMGFYGKCGYIEESENIFHESFHEGSVVWNVMLSVHNEKGEVEKVLKLYRQMHEENVIPDERTFVIVLQSCCTLAEIEGRDDGNRKPFALVVGESLHADILRKGLYSDPYISSGLVCLYGKCGHVKNAENVFVGFSESNTILWNAILLTHLEQGEAVKTLQLYAEMNKDCVLSDKGTYMIALQAVCTLAEKEKAQLIQKRFIKITALSIGRKLHDSVKERGFGSDVFIANTILTMYGKCRSISDAENVFSELSNSDTVSWNAMLSAYIEQGQGDKAFHLFSKMQEKDVMLDEITLGCLLQACSLTGKKDICRQIHFIIVSSGSDSSLMLSTTLIHAYGTCALTADAQSIFSRLSSPDVIAWSALIASYAREGKVNASLQAFDKMLENNIKPTSLTFLSVLLACSHGGLVDKGVELFESMSKDYGINPELEHYLSMVDLLAHAGDFGRLECMITQMPMQSDASFWIGLLNACQRHGNSKLSKLIFEKAACIKETHPAAYTLMSNMCAEGGKLPVVEQ